MNSSAQKIQHLFNRFLMDYMQVNKHTTSGQLLMVNTQQAISNSSHALAPTDL